MPVIAVWITLDFRPSSGTKECKGENDRRKESEHIWQSEHIEQRFPCRRVGVDRLFRPSNQHSSDQPESNAKDITDCCNEYASKGNAEPIHLAKNKPSAEHCEADSEKKRRIEQNLSVGHGQITIDYTEQDRPVTVAGVESNPCFPHCRFTGEDRRYISHSHLQSGIAWRQFLARKRVHEMNGTQRQDYCGTE
jgi:hypothetical protein